MTLFPTINGCSFITDTSFCTIVGTPHDIVRSLLSEVIQIDESMSVQVQKVKNVDVVMTSHIADLFCVELENVGITVRQIYSAAPNQVVKDAVKNG